ncbi:bacillithiol biosynthesis cysteine-adding enzyme BshC [Agriterribacter sp.]|uniref:bacillithiol biosynthesis cysteine-adding enzyme BshC n=1 Tax=Agriterribacter sp. TaxID=2821509 RepID=UPI002CFD0896|nr:bacillithiol biosynthesis cysteine-adding enzyme BshC [Agriterribacter sp.]HRO46261.1 bacillithiol biosynthesis cysteine-adding enzyme BshC [Agriterribacter sp.]HRQ18405.1 bacillithiol biosynthesis cysteine-adding enzyme BshC [Agriterribacter sp.]
MNFTAEWISYDSTNAFSALAIDYLHQHTSLQPFYQYTPDLQGIAGAIDARKAFSTDRTILVAALKTQYEGIAASAKVKANIEKLAFSNTFTVCTAHQPNLFTGYLYFIYKIVHAIKLADELNTAFPQNHFVPVYYMGSEDNDQEELNHIFLNNEKLVWETRQTGAVGKMHTKGLDALIHRISGELGVLEHGQQLVALLKSCYCQSSTVQEATLKLVNTLFESYGLVVLIADDAALKKAMTGVFEDDLFRHTPATIVTQTAQQLAAAYHAQVNPRDINLFYMKGSTRERIIKTGDGFTVNNTDICFSSAAISDELHAHPERFSPNVVLRGLYQETILPNVAFIGGGSEIAYWLELKDMFTHYGVPYPVLLLRNSFLIAEKKMGQLMDKLNIAAEALFKEEALLLNNIVRSRSSLQLTLEKETHQLAALYKHIGTVSQRVDTTLTQHVNALETKAVKALKSLEKKMLRAEKKRYTVQSVQLHTLKSALFPRNTLQERVENILPYYARYGPSFIDMLYAHAPTFDKKFGVLREA